MASSDNEDYYCCEDDDESYQSAPDYTDYEDGGGDLSGDDDDYMKGDEAQADEAEDEALEAWGEKRYTFLTEDDVRALQDEHTARVAELFSLPPAFAAVVLRHCEWSASAVEQWFSDEQRIRDAVGLPVDGAPTALNDRPLTCAICFDPYSAGEMRSAGCSHFYCHECWRGYVRAAVEDGPRCLSVRCPDPSCTVAVVRELVDVVADDEVRRRYAEFALRSYVEESKKFRWCPGPGCTLAVEFLNGEQCKEQLDVVCACKHGFCLRCGEEAHRPVSCETVSRWLEKNVSESETMNWLLTNTKQCPKCRRPIEKNMGCMHMTCGHPCRHEFCWLCLVAWDKHGQRDYYHCNRYQARKPTAEESQREQAKASLERYLHYYERWAAHGKSRHKALEDMAELELGEMERLAEEVGVPETQLAFLTEAYERIAECRRMLKWTYAYGYYLDPERDAAKAELFVYLQEQAEVALERLHGCAERERRDLRCEDAAIPYRQKLAGLTLTTTKHFEKFMEAFEAGLAEVAEPLIHHSEEFEAGLAEAVEPVHHTSDEQPEEPAN